MLSSRVARAGLRASAQQFAVPRTAAINGLRSYATPAQNVSPPVALFGVDGTYASALVRLCALLPHCVYPVSPAPAHPPSFCHLEPHMPKENHPN